MTQTSLSVVIPTKNRPQYALRAITSIREQGHQNTEIVLVDDGSQERYDFLSALSQSDLSYLRLETSVGAARARNAGVARAQGDWIAFLDDDDDWRPGFLGTLYDRLDRFQGKDAFFWCSVVDIDYAPDGTITNERLRSFSDANDRSHASLCADALSIGTSFGLTMPRSTFMRVGQFDPTFRLIEDTELITRLLINGCTPNPIAHAGVNIRHRVDLSRLTHHSKNQLRSAEIERMLSIHELYFAKNISLRDGLRSYAKSLMAQP